VIELNLTRSSFLGKYEKKGQYHDFLKNPSCETEGGRGAERKSSVEFDVKKKKPSFPPRKTRPERHRNALSEGGVTPFTVEVGGFGAHRLGGGRIH